MMTKREYLGKLQIIKLLNEQGYPTYSRLFDKFDLNLTKDPKVIAYMQPGKARIVVNQNLSIDQVSTVIRHEILHDYLQHQTRMEKKMGKDVWDKRTPQMHRNSNIAGDYEISNRGYTDADKENSRNLILGDKILHGLVTDDDHPEWVNLSLEEIYDELEKQRQQDEQDGQENTQIGDTGDEATQAAEQAEREANAISDDAGEMIEQNQQNGGSPQDSQNAKQLKATADKLADEANKAKNAVTGEGNGNGDVFETAEEKEKNKKIQERIKQIQDALNDAKQKAAILKDTDDAVNKEKVAKAASDLNRFTGSPLYQLKLNMYRLISNQVAQAPGRSWSKVNKRAYVAGLVAPGKSNHVKGLIPTLNVYFDRSGSWDDPEKSKKGFEALSTIRKFEKDGKLKINLYYFSNSVEHTEQDALAQGGTEGQPILDHINATHPDNVMIVTDSDIDDCTSNIELNGGVWLVFVGKPSQNNKSQNLINHIHGKKQTLVVELPY